MINNLTIIDDIIGTVENIKEITLTWFELVAIAIATLPTPFQTLISIAVPIFIFIIALAFWDKIT